METEVYRLTPEKGTYYEYAECTRKEGRWPNERYYTTNPLEFVGKFIEHISEGCRDNANHWGIFENGTVHYSYEGNTCFRVRTQKSPDETARGDTPEKIVIQ